MYSIRRIPRSPRTALATVWAAGIMVAAACGGTAGSTPAGGAVLGATSSPAATTAPAGSEPSGAFHLSKTCNGFNCVVSTSSLAAIPVGTSITYTGDPAALAATIHEPDGTASGTCDIAASPGSCRFSVGTGSLAGLHLAVAVTTDASGVWHWDGTYSFSFGRVSFLGGEVSRVRRLAPGRTVHT